MAVGRLFRGVRKRVLMNDETSFVRVPAPLFRQTLAIVGSLPAKSVARLYLALSELPPEPAEESQNSDDPE